MQHGSHSTSCVPCPPLWFLSFLLSLTLQALYFNYLSNHLNRYHGLTTCALQPTSTTAANSNHNHNHLMPHCHPKSRRSNNEQNYHPRESAKTKCTLSSTLCLPFEHTMRRRSSLSSESLVSTRLLPLGASTSASSPRAFQLTVR